MSQVLKGEDDDAESSFKPMIYNMYQHYQVNDQEDYARTISEYRSRLHTDTVQAMVLYGDWLKKTCSWLQNLVN